MKQSQRIALIAIVAALYAVLTVVFAPISYGPIQLRIAEVVKPVMFYLPLEGTVGLILGIIVGNFFSPMGISDVLQAIPGVAIQGVLVYLFTVQLWEAALLISFAVALWVGTYLSLMYKLPWLVTITSILISEVVVVFLIGVPVWRTVQRRLPALLKERR